jgi:hypothetical protein
MSCDVIVLLALAPWMIIVDSKILFSDDMFDSTFLRMPDASCPLAFRMTRNIINYERLTDFFITLLLCFQFLEQPGSLSFINTYTREHCSDNSGIQARE